MINISLAPFFNRIKMWRKFKGHAVVGAGGVIGPRGKMIEVKPQGKKGIDSTASSVIRAPGLGQSFPRPMPGMPMPMPGMNPYIQQPPRGPYGPPR